MNIMKRGKVWNLRRRVPKRYAPVEERGEIWISLHTDSERAARDKAPGVWEEQIAVWEAKLAGNDTTASRHVDAMRDIAAAKGLRYMPMDKVVDLPLEALLSRIEAIGTKGHRPDPVEAAAVLGTAKHSMMTVTQALETYWSLAKDKTYGKSADQIRRWANPRKKAVRIFVTVVGDKPIDEITADDMLDMRTALQDRIEADAIKPQSANKDLIHLGDVLKTVNSMKRLGLVLPLGGLTFREAEQEERPSFSDAWIRDRILKNGALSQLDPEARAILLGMINTGYRPSEAACALPGQFRLNADVPHLMVQPRIDRQIKNKNSKRLLPLVGVSLQALRDFPEGFPRYRDDNSTLSSTINRYLRGHGLMESDRHVMYSLRHSFEDRLLRAGIDDRIRSDLMGHTSHRQKYGDGGGLEFKAKALQKIAF
ncbi:Phage integrase family protein [Roseivivax marinus]|uniref:DUF6538 domain-containing protein n=1 Tax=Roseivivax marinus TaxID=1379903 RepID=UPI0008ABBA01|nr:DUF6538 domain-containing protein [Roseivivax marinus]SEL59317.1 Phage integrase family protein [Roseivivax marinus]